MIPVWLAPGNRVSLPGSRRLASRAGFTLLEVLVAMLIIGVVFATVFEGLSQSKRISIRAKEKMEAARIAQNLLMDTPLIKKALKDGRAQGEVPQEKNWAYRLTVVPLELVTAPKTDPKVIPGMMKLTLCVYLETEETPHLFCLDRWYRQGG